MRKIWVTAAFLVLVACFNVLTAPQGRAQIGIMGAPDLNCLLQNGGVNNASFPGGVPSGTAFATVNATTNATPNPTIFDATNIGPNLTLSGGNLSVSGGALTGSSNVFSTTSQLNTTIYFRATFGTVGAGDGIGVSNTATTTSPGGGSGSAVYFPSNGSVFSNGFGQVGTAATLTNGQFVDIAINLPLALIWIRPNGPGNEWNLDVLANQDPATATGGFSIFGVSSGNVKIIYGTTNTIGTVTLNPTPNLGADSTVRGLSPWQPFIQIACNSTSVALSGTDAAKFSLAGSSSAAVPVSLNTSGVIAAGTYHIILTFTISGAENSPLAVPITITGSVGGIEDPGPSTYLYTNHFYTCTNNYYVSTTGSDGNSGTSSGSPWLTLQHAANTVTSPASCINVASGTYPEVVLTTNGGNAPTPTGYIAWRCSTLDACHVTAQAAGQYVFGIQQPANFVVIDGFELDGNSSSTFGGLAQACALSSGDDFGTGQSSHHLWVLNSLIHDCNLAGIAFSNKEWYYVIHNTVYNNSYTNQFQGSGIGLVVVQCIEQGVAQCASGSTYSGGTGTYIPSGMDLTYAPPYHILQIGNVVHNNMIAASNVIGCGNHTDGNGIILDTWADEPTKGLIFPYPSLTALNVSYSNGGRGIHVFGASNATIANNTTWGNNTDTCIPAGAIGDLSQQGGSNDNWYNNTALTVQTTGNNPACPSSVQQFCGAHNSPFVAGAGGTGGDSNNTYFSNVAFGGVGVALFNNDIGYFSSVNNQTATSPGSVGAAAPSYASPSTGNFAITAGTSVGYGVAVPSGGLFSPTASGPSGQFVDSGGCYHTLSTCP